MGTREFGKPKGNWKRELSNQLSGKPVVILGEEKVEEKRVVVNKDPKVEQAALIEKSLFGWVIQKVGIP